MASMELRGMDEMLKKIEEMGRKGTRIQNQALRKAAEPILEDAYKGAPHNTNKGREGLKIGRVQTKGDERFVLVGIDAKDNSDIYYMKFHEFGTTKMKARPFMSPAYEGNKANAINILADEFRKGLGI